jgi:purine-cytosine permease-like protein
MKPVQGSRTRIVAMSLKSVTETVDSVLTLATVGVCLVVWAAVGFPYLIVMGAAAACLILICVGTIVWRKSRQRG